MSSVIVDTGFLVAYGRAGDPLHAKADLFVKHFDGDLVTVAAVIVETCFFLNARAKQRLLGWAHEGSIAVVDVPVVAYQDLATTLAKYAGREVDFADAALIWLAEETGFREILTVDETDFSVFRLKGGKRFQLIDWR
ncbi:MAG TPA: PIN domain-containing protein [Burkholderiales bacterium]|nr:PIN domain-containing protein [Burkholderiales bacterium]